MTSDLDRITMWSGKYYRANLEGDRFVYSPVREVASQSPLATPHCNQPRGKSSPTPPPLEDDMDAHMKLPTFKGVGDEDMDQFWFVAGSIWTAQNVASDVVKRVLLSLAFEGRALDWYMRYIAH